MLGRAASEAGHTDRDGAAVSKRVRDYFKAAGIDWPDDQPPPYWGGALLAFVAIREGLTPPPNAIDADSWLGWGHPRAAPETGAIVILTGGSGSRLHQIGVVMRVAGDKIYVQHCVNGQVAIEAVNADRVIATRWPPSTPGQLAAAQPSTVSQEVRLVIDHQGGAPVTAGLPAPDRALPPVIDHVPASVEELLQRMAAELNAMKMKMQWLETEFKEHSHQPRKKDGTLIAWDDLVLRSEMKVKAA